MGHEGAALLARVDALIRDAPTRIGSSSLLREIWSLSASSPGLAESFDPGALAPDAADLFDRICHAPASVREVLGGWQVVGMPGESVQGGLSEGDLVIRRALGEGRLAHASMLVSGQLHRGDELDMAGLASAHHQPGLYAQVVESEPAPRSCGDRVARLILGEEGQLGRDTLVLRVRPPSTPWVAGDGAEASDRPRPLGAAEARRSKKVLGGKRGLGKAAVLADYRVQARKLIGMQVGLTREWLRRIERPKITKYPRRTESELQKAAIQGNALTQALWNAERRRDIYGKLVVDHIPFLQNRTTGSPRGKPSTTVGTIEYIEANFSRAALQRQGYPRDFPEIIPLLDALGSVSITAQDITDEVLARTNPETLLAAAKNELGKPGGLLQYSNRQTPPFVLPTLSPSELERRWGIPATDPTPNAPRVRISYRVSGETRERWLELPWSAAQLHAMAISQKLVEGIERLRRTAEAHLRRIAKPDPAETAVVDSASTKPGHNLEAVRFVLRRLYEAEEARAEQARQRLREFLFRNPLLQQWSKESAVRNNMQTVGRRYQSVFDTNDIDADELKEKLDEAIAGLDELEKDANEGDDLLFEGGLSQGLGPLIELYREVDPRYGAFIEAEFEKRKKSRERTNDALRLGGSLLFMLSFVLPLGLATAAIIGGFAASTALVIRTSTRASALSAAALAGLASQEARALASYAKWFERALLALEAISVLFRPIQLAIKLAIKGGKALHRALRSIRVFVVKPPTTLTFGQRTFVDEVGRRLVELARQARQRARARPDWDQLGFGGQGTAIHSEWFQLVRQEMGKTLPRNIIVESGRPTATFPHGYAGLKPDLRLSMPNGREVVFDLTTRRAANKAGKYDRGWVDAIIEILY